MDNWIWVTAEVAMAAHAEQIAEHGGGEGVRDAGLLDSAIARALNLVAYGKPDAADLAAACSYGLAKNHPFVDGNKRAAFLAAGLFLAMNGLRLCATQAEATVAMFTLAAGELDEAGLADWLRKHSQSREAPR